MFGLWSVRLSGAVVVCCDRFRPYITYIGLHKCEDGWDFFAFLCCLELVLSIWWCWFAVVCITDTGSKVVGLSDPVSVVCMCVACWETVGLYPWIVQIAGGSRVEFGAPSNFFAIPLTDRFCELLLFKKKLKTSSWILMERLSLKRSHVFVRLRLRRQFSIA